MTTKSRRRLRSIGEGTVKASRKNFKATLEELAELRSTFWEWARAFDAACVEAQVKAAKAKFPRKRIDAYSKLSKLLDKDECDSIMKHRREEAEISYNDYADEVKAIEYRLDDMAAKLKPRAGDTTATLDSVWIGSYRTQGWGAESYAKGSADRMALRASVCKIPVEVVKRFEDINGKSKPWAFDVIVSVEDPIDVELIKRRPTLSIRDEIKFCLQHGLNIRVYNPFLPHGIEEKLGLDHFGNDVEGYSHKEK